MYKIKYRSPDEMKDSYVEWLRRIPKDWNIKRLKYISECIPSNVDKKSKPGEKPVKLCNYTDVYYNDYINGSIHFMDATATRTEIIKFGLKEGDIILTKDSESPDDIGIASYVKERVNNLVCGYHLIIIKSNKRSSSLYLYFHLLCKGIRNYFEINANGITRYGLGVNVFKNVLISLPSDNDQHKIANFLDIKTAQFDSIISKKELLIKKLEEAKKSLISEVVTGKVKIVNGKMVPRQPQEMKDSGVEWLGMIPKNWVITKVKYYYDVQLGKMLQPNKKSKRDTLEKYICTINVDWDSLRLDLVKEMWFSNTERAKYLVKNGDLIVNEGGDAGKASIVTNTNNNLYIQNAVHRVRAKKLYTVKYLYYWLFVLKSNKYIDLLCNKATIMHFTNEKFNELLLPLPKGEEDLSLTKYLDDKVSYINDVIKKTTELIQKLKQAKQSLISEAVTGKIDLRDWEIIEEGGIQ